MDLAVASYAVAVAAVTALAFAALHGIGRLASRLGRRRPSFLATVANEPAERLRHRAKRIAGLRSLLMMPLLVFIIAAVVLTFAEPPVPDALRETWRQLTVIAVVFLAAAAVLARALMLTLERRRLALRIDAAIAVAQALTRISANRNRVFHDVPTGFGVMDHVIVGLHGIYAIKVVARLPVRNAKLSLENDILRFGEKRRPASLVHTRKICDRFARECAKLLGHDLHVRLVVAVPGWDVQAQTSRDLLVANERNISMLTGWKDERDYLMNEDVDTLHRRLDERCARRQ